MKNLIDDQPNRNSFSHFELMTCVSLNARLCALMLPSPAPKVNAGIAVRQRGRLQPMRLVEAVPDEEAIRVESDCDRP